MPAFLVILAGVSAALHVGKLAPALPTLQHAMTISLLQAGFLLSLSQLAGMTLGLVAGLTADRMGLRRSMMAGLCVLSFASFAGAWAQSAAALLIFRAIEGFGFLWVATPAPSLIRQLVSANDLSRMLGLWGTYMPLGAALAMLLGPLFILAAGWQAWWLFLAMLSGVMAVVLWFCVPSDADRRSEMMRDAEFHAAATLPLASWQLRLRQTLSAPGPWLVALCFAMYSGQWLAVVGFLPSIYVQAGVAAGTTGLLTALAAGVNITGNAAAGWLLQRGWAPPRLLVLGYSAMAGGAALTFSNFGFPDAVNAVNPALRYAAVLMFSAVGGLIPGTLFWLAVKLAPNEATVSTTVGWMQQLSATGQFFGPPLVAWVASFSGDWRSSWWVTGACSLVGLWLSRELGYLLRRQTPGQ